MQGRLGATISSADRRAALGWASFRYGHVRTDPSQPGSLRRDWIA
jgi:hypothetical protein